MTSLGLLSRITFQASYRDRTLQAVIGTGLLLFVLVPVLSLFSMRQVHELSVTLSLSVNSVILLFLAFFLGGTTLWRDIEKRNTATVLGLPISRHGYVVGKFCGVAVFLLLCAIFLSLVATLDVLLFGSQELTVKPFLWGNFFAAIACDFLKSLLIVAIAILFSTVSTSLFLPVFGTVAIYFAGSASQEVMEFISGEYGTTIPAFAKSIIHVIYYLLPNLAIFDLKVQAVYGLVLSWQSLFYPLLYGLLYTTIVLWLASWFFQRRELA